MTTKPRLSVSLVQLEVLRQIVLELNKNGDGVQKWRLLHDQNFGVGKVIETTVGEYNVWISYKATPEAKPQLIHWFEWLVTSYIPTYLGIESFICAVTEGKHPVDVILNHKQPVDA